MFMNMLRLVLDVSRNQDCLIFLYDCSMIFVV